MERFRLSGHTRPLRIGAGRPFCPPISSPASICPTIRIWDSRPMPVCSLKPTGRSGWPREPAAWNTFIGRNLNAAANIADAAAVGGAGESPGFLLTDWGDNGHFQPLAVSLPSMVRGGAAATGESIDDDALVAERIDELLGCERGVGALIDRLGCIGEELGVKSPNSSPLFSSLFGTGIPSFGEPDPEGLARGLQRWPRPPIGFPDRSEVTGERLWPLRWHRPAAWPPSDCASSALTTDWTSKRRRRARSPPPQKPSVLRGCFPAVLAALTTQSASCSASSPTPIRWPRECSS